VAACHSEESGRNEWIKTAHWIYVCVGRKGGVGGGVGVGGGCSVCYLLELVSSRMHASPQTL